MKKMFFLCLCSFAMNISVEAQTYSKEIADYRENYKAKFLSEENSPLDKEDLKYLDFFEGDSSYNVLCTFKKSKSKKQLEIPTSSGKNKIFVKLGELHFEIKGNKAHLSVYQNIMLLSNPLYKNYLFVPFTDLTNKKSTYGGGRYIDFGLSDLKKDKIYLDFNKAYNPYCAFSDGYSCPVPPKENHLTFEINAGEKNFLKGH